MSGFYLVTRGITSHHLFKGNPQRLAVWLWLLDNAAWKPTTHDVKGHTIEVPRGAVCASERHIADECGVGYQVVRTALKRFQSERMINATVTHGKTVITLCNYEKHQSPERGDNAEGNATLTQRQRNANAQKKQGNKETREEPYGSSTHAPAEPAAFDAFWDAYPHRGGAKKGKAKAAQKFSAAVRAGASPQQIIDGARRYAGDRQVLSGYARDPTTWLNNRGWDDDIEPPAPKGGTHGNGNQHSGQSTSGRGSTGHGELFAGFADAAGRKRRPESGAAFGPGDPGMDLHADSDPAGELLRFPASAGGAVSYR